MTVLNLQVAASLDDVQWYEDESGFFQTGSSISCGVVVGPKSSDLAARISTPTGLSGKTINSATFSTYVLADGDANTASRVSAEDAESPTQIGSAADGNGRTLTTANADRSGQLSVQNDWEDLDVTALVQELADSYDPDWIQLIEKDNGSTYVDGMQLYQYRSYNGSSSQAPKLDIDVDADAGDLNVLEGAESIPDGTSTARDYGNVLIDPDPLSPTAPLKTFPVENLGELSITITGVTFSPTTPFTVDFATSEIPAFGSTVIGPGESKDLVVKCLNSQALVDFLGGPGTYTAEIRIASNDPDEAVYNFPLSVRFVTAGCGIACAPPEASVHSLAHPPTHRH